MANTERLLNHQDALDVLSTLDTINDSLNKYMIKGDTSFANSSDSDFVSLIAQADAGSIDLEKDYGWTVGDKRKITLRSMSSGTNHNSHSTQSNTLVIVNKGRFNKTGGGKVNFVLALEHPLLETEIVSSTNSNSTMWENCRGKKCCDDIFTNMVPSSIKSAFKQFAVPACAPGGTKDSNLTTVNAYCTLPSIVELCNPSCISSLTASNTNKNELISENPFEYFSRSSFPLVSSIIRFLGKSGSIQMATRSPNFTNTTYAWIMTINAVNATSINYSLTPTGATANTARYFLPIFAI